MSPAGEPDSLERLLYETCEADQLGASAWRARALSAASEYWRASMTGHHLDRRMRELVLVGIHASPASLHAPGVERHIERALKAGATHDEVIDVVFTVVGLANHALYTSVPILDEELEAAGVVAERTAPSPAYQAAKDAFIASRGFWEQRRDLIAELIPDYSAALDRLSTEAWRGGPLSPKDRTLVCIGIDSTVNHLFEPGLRRHIRNALGHGATAGEILEVLQLAGVIGLESYITGTQVLFGRE
ncbi:hypothetical protein ASG91_19025 [Phycicoccus sp. Soil802]|nr:hypothetical protein ASG91_19025 [Phycicoccus sp. Soil802]